MSRGRPLTVLTAASRRCRHMVVFWRKLVSSAERFAIGRAGPCMTAVEENVRDERCRQGSEAVLFPLFPQLCRACYGLCHKCCGNRDSACFEQVCNPLTMQTDSQLSARRQGGMSCTHTAPAGAGGACDDQHAHMFWKQAGPALIRALKNRRIGKAGCRGVLPTRVAPGLLGGVPSSARSY